MTDITGIKLETIRPIFLLHAAQLSRRMFGSGPFCTQKLSFSFFNNAFLKFRLAKMSKILII